MGHYGVYIFSAYGLAFAVLAVNIIMPLLRYRYLRQNKQESTH